MSCKSCKNINFDNCPTYQDLLEAPHLDFYYEELEKDIPNDTHWEEGDNLMAVIHCYDCGTTRKANGEVVKGGVTKDEIEDYGKEYSLDDFEITKIEEYDFSKKEVRDEYNKLNKNKDYE
tara:strand:- start:20 stop:379 length:360 start_codon:yes stop_codon:yes gene_type:complete